MSDRDKYYEKLLEDTDCRGFLIRDALNEGRIVWRYPKEQIGALVMPAKFASLDEKSYVAHMINRFIKVVDCLPWITKHEGRDFADRCLFSTSFFWDYMEKRRRRFGAPSPEFYLAAGQEEYKTMGKRDLAFNMHNWRNFLAQRFAA